MFLSQRIARFGVMYTCSYAQLLTRARARVRARARIY